MCQSGCVIKLWVQFYPLNSFRRGEEGVTGEDLESTTLEPVSLKKAYEELP